ncbi:dolichyl-phosphate-mannose--protein mannosyltransferase [Streptosporangium sp. NPDC004631]
MEKDRDETGMPASGTRDGPSDPPESSPSPGPADPGTRPGADRPAPRTRGAAVWGWAGPLLVAAFGAALRFNQLGRPHAVMFDEIYYAKEGLSLITFGVERTALGTATEHTADDRLLAGNTDIWVHCTPPDAAPCPQYVVHPPLGKWMIGAGEWLFGADPFGWRFAAALAGVLSILILARVARRMTGSTPLGCLAGLLLALDGLHLVLSRTALLDVFLMFWVLAGFACLVLDRDRAGERPAALWGSAPPAAGGPLLGTRPWRIAAGLCLGAACAVKWSGVFFLVAFAVMSLAWDVGARRAAGTPGPRRGALTAGAPTALLAMGVIPALTYLASWTGWFLSPLGYGRNWARAASQDPVHSVLDSLRSWADYHLMALRFHTGLTSSHPYQSDPWQWPLLLRPVAFHYQTPTGACGTGGCSQAVLGVGTPVIWYGALAALIAMVVWYVDARDWRAGAILLAYGAGWLPWFYYALIDNRTMFLFYMAPLLPFMMLALTLAAGLLIGPRSAPARRRAVGWAVVGVFTMAALANLWWLYPVLSGEIVAQGRWSARMLLRSWI